MNLTEMTQAILQKIPQTMIPTIDDGILVRAYKDFFQRHEDTLINDFYNLIYTDLSTQLIIGDPSLRPQRENTLRQWYQITTSGNFDNEYWSWQALVGIVHVKHKIPNASMLSMWSWLINFLQARLLEELPTPQAQAVIIVLQKLHATASSLIVESFLMTQQEAITRASGLNERILGRFINTEIDELLKQGREIQQQSINNTQSSVA
jgi:hypothetical protein